MYSRLSFFPPLSPSYSHFLRASRFSLSVHTHIPPLLLCITIPRVFFYLRFAIYEGMANIPQRIYHLPSPRRSLSSYPFLFLASLLPFFILPPSLFLSLSLSLWVVHTVIASLLKFKRDSSRPIRTFPVIHPCYLIPSLLICTECWDLLLVARRARREKRGSELNLCSELARQFAPYISRYTGQMDCRIFTVSGMASMDIICRWRWFQWVKTRVIVEEKLIVQVFHFQVE